MSKIAVPIDDRVITVMNDLINTYKRLCFEFAQSLHKTKNSDQYTDKEVSLMQSIALLDSLLDNGHEIYLTTQSDPVITAHLKNMFEKGEYFRERTERCNGEIVGEAFVRKLDD